MAVLETTLYYLYFVMEFSISDPWGFVASLTSRLTVRGAKINMDPLPGKFVKCSDVSSFLGIAEHFEVTFFLTIFRLIKLNTLFTH